MGATGDNDDEASALCDALHAVVLADAGPAAVEWVVTGRWPTVSAPPVQIQWPNHGTKGLEL